MSLNTISLTFETSTLDTVCVSCRFEKDNKGVNKLASWKVVSVNGERTLVDIREYTENPLLKAEIIGKIFEHYVNNMVMIKRGH